MAVVYKRGFYLGKTNKKQILVIGIALILIAVSWLIVRFINGRSVSVSEHASTKIEPAIVSYQATGNCDGDTFVVKYTIRVSVPGTGENTQHYNYDLKAFIPGVIKKEWITYVSGGGNIKGEYYIEWSGNITSGTTKDFIYTLTLPGGALQPGAEFKNIALLKKPSGDTDKQTASIIINSCGVKTTNPITPTSTPAPTNSSSETSSYDLGGGDDNTTSTVSTSTGLEQFATVDAGESITNNSTVDNETEASSSRINEQSTQESANTQNDSEVTYVAPSYATNPQYASSAQAPNTGIVDSPLTAVFLLLVGIILKLTVYKNRSYKPIVEETF